MKHSCEIELKFEPVVNDGMSFLLDLFLYIPVNNDSVISGAVFLGLTSTKLGLMCLDQGHNAAAPVRFEPATLCCLEPFRQRICFSSCSHFVYALWATFI